MTFVAPNYLAPCDTCGTTLGLCSKRPEGRKFTLPDGTVRCIPCQIAAGDEPRYDEQYSSDVTTVAGDISVSKQMLDHARAFNEAYHRALMDMLLNPPTPEQIAARTAERAAEWDAKRARGLVGIYDHSDYGCGPEWVEVERGQHVERWVTRASWDRYWSAFEALYEAEEALEELP